ncbi:MAG TPA: IS21-like element helper ATPase IstB [Chloroflexota bacterium]|nr:IS21-like element helper ATPase IstB [Chloroflexota bacterium]
MRMVTTTSLVHPLMPKLKQLRLSGMLGTLEVRADQAAREHLAPGEFLALLLDDEIERRDQGRLRLRLQEAGWEEGKTLARFDFSALPGLNRTLVAELKTCAFVERHDNVLICGPAGVGKSHLMAGLAFEAIKRGHRVIMRPVHQILNDLQAARADGGYSRKLTKICTVDFLILDDFGLRPLAPSAVDDLYEIVTRRYETRSIRITSNRSLEEWPDVFGDGLLASAALDRLTHHARMLVMTGPIYRQRDRHKEVDTRQPTGAPAPTTNDHPNSLDSR